MLTDESPSPVHEENESLTLATAEIFSQHILKRIWSNPHPLIILISPTLFADPLIKRTQTHCWEPQCQLQKNYFEIL